MAGLSRVPFSLLQTLTSSDLGTAFRLLGRDVLEALRYLTGDRAVVLGGLAVSATTTGASVAPGALLTPYAGGGMSAPRDDESAFVLGLSATPIAVSIALPPSNTWYTIEARAIERDTRDTRGVYSELLGETTPQTLLVRREVALEVRARAGTELEVAAPVTGWVPLGGVLRRVTGTPEPVADLVDLRPLIAQEGSAAAEATGTERFEAHDYTLITDAQSGYSLSTPQLRIDVCVVDRTGLRLRARGTFPLPSLFAGDFVATPARWHYLYLSPLRGQAITTPTGKGLLVLSQVPPSVQGGRANGAPISGPLGYTIATGEATCIGALWTNTFEDLCWMPQHCVRGRHQCPHDTSNALGATDLWNAWRFPRNARSLLTMVDWPGSDSRVISLFSPALSAVPISDATRLAYGVHEGEANPWPMPEFPVDGVDPEDIKVLGFTGGGVLRLEAVIW